MPVVDPLQERVLLMADVSPLQKARAEYSPKLPPVLAKCGPFVKCDDGAPTESVADQADVRAIFPLTYGAPVITFGRSRKTETQALKAAVILSGGQAPGGHNVIAGLFDGIKAYNAGCELYGFLGGPSGLIDNKHQLLTAEIIDAYRNTGGFDIIGSGRTKLETEQQFASVVKTCRTHGITAVVVIGGDDSNTNACMLAEYMERLARADTTQPRIQVLGVPKTIDGDLKNEQIEISFGFDTATKVYSELIGNIQRDANSAKKYYHFIKLMGRSASHITLECALQTHANIAIVSEEIAQKKQTLRDVVSEVATAVRNRAAAGMNFGVVLIPEGLIEFIPEIKALISELNDLLARTGTEFQALQNTDQKIQFVAGRLSTVTAAAFKSLPATIQTQLLMDRDPHGNVQVSRIETEKLLVEMVEAQLKEWKAAGAYKGKFSAQTHFFGYEGRCAAPSNFDADYCYSLGYCAAALVAAGKTGYMASVRNTAAPSTKWTAGGIPLTLMMNLERRHGENRPVIRKALVDLGGKPFAALAANRTQWANANEYLYPGPIQYFGPSEVCDRTTLTLALERG